MASNLAHEFYRSAKPNTTVIMYLHGFLGGGDDWLETIDLLGDDYSHLTVDLHATETGSMKLLAERLVQLLDDRKINRCHLVGYSMGGRLALYFATYHARRVDRLVIESGSPGLQTAGERQTRRENDLRLAERLKREPLEKFLTDWYAQPLFATLDTDSARFAALLNKRRLAKASLLTEALEKIGTGAQPSLWSELPGLKPPTLFVAGESDAKFSCLADQMADLCPSGRVAIISEAGHNVHFEQREQFCRQVDRFLKRNERGKHG